MDSALLNKLGLSDLPSEEKNQFFSSDKLLLIPAGATLFSEGSPCTGFPILLEGSVKVVKQASNGREILLYRIVTGQSCLISSSCLLGNIKYNARGITESSVKLLLIPTLEFNQLIVRYARFREFVFNLYSGRLSELMQLVEAVAFNRLDQRIAKLLLGRPEAPIQASHQQIADELGSVREIVSRLLKNMVNQNLISLSREQILILDRENLTKLYLR